jgi:two-component system, chemotaxis family, chemotaxis protein CheY
MHRTVLIVEDADECAATLEIALATIGGLTVHWTPSAEEALEVLARGGIAAVVTDLHLPQMDGFELVMRVRGTPALARLPIVVISGDTDPRAAERALGLGANAFFPKPYSPAQVRTMVERLLDAA